MVQEKKNRAYLKTNLTNLFAGGLLLPISTYQRIVRQYISDIRSHTVSAANQVSLVQRLEQPIDSKRSSILDIAAMGLTAKLAAETLHTPGSISKSGSSIDRIATNETFHSFNKHYIDNHRLLNGYWEWIAVLDKRTCQECEDLDMRKFDDPKDIPDLPIHINCRCSVIFLPNK